jgi:hypothetical protein
MPDFKVPLIFSTPWRGVLIETGGAHPADRELTT